MSVSLIVGIIIAYFLLLITISWFTSRNASSQDFYLGSRQSPWYVVAFGMIGASLSGVTFISVPGWPGLLNGAEGAQLYDGFNYFQMVLGYLVGYAVIAWVLLPLYYRLQLTSIYTYLEQRLGRASYKMGASFFLISRIIGASFRLFLVALVFDIAIFQPLNWDVHFMVPVAITVGLIWLYTFRGGIKTIIWTDTLQTSFMLIAVVVTIYYVAKELNLSGVGEVYQAVAQSDFSQIFFLDNFNDGRHFIKQFVAGAFIAIAMTGLDQDMMQKNLSCRNLKEAKWNVFSFSFVLLFVNLLFLGLGALLYLYANQTGMAAPARADELFPTIALQSGLPLAVGIFFVLGLIASAYSSADSALTALTTSFCVDILELDKKGNPEKEKRTRFMVHLGMSVVLILVITSFSQLGDESVIKGIFKIAGYTYGPLLGLYAFGLFTKLGVRDRLVPIVCIAAPILSFLLQHNSKEWFGGYEIGFELLPLNGLITFLGLLLLSTRKELVKAE